MMFMMMCKGCGHRSWHRLSVGERDYGAHLCCQAKNANGTQCDCLIDVTSVIGPAVVRAYDAEHEFREPMYYQ